MLRTVDKLKQQGVNVVGSQDGYFSDEELLINEIRRSGAKILSVALGSPKQELFMKKAKDSGLTCFMMGVGGTYNVFVGEVKRAPDFWCRLNLEWLYRLLSEPSRIFRQIKLTKYVYLALANKL
nr:WecB/TagA/CpsF family glycosyltransferase [Vibrio alginolyticus]